MDTDENKGKMKPTEEQIREIADALDAGLIPYFNIKTGETDEVIDLEQVYDPEIASGWQETIDKIEANFEDWVGFEKFESWESFKIMERFIATIDDEDLKNELSGAILKRKPFANFKWVIDGAGEYRQKWFDFKQKEYMDHIRQQIKWHFRSPDENGIYDIITGDE